MSFSFGMIRAVASEIGSGKFDPQRQLDKQVNGYIYDSSGERILAVLRGSEARTRIEYDEIADPMRHAIVAIEDRRYWEHDGIDLRGIGRALVADIRHKKVVEGGSTITQQFVKNALDRDQKTIGRKVREAAFAWQLERDDEHWGKQRILAVLRGSEARTRIEYDEIADPMRHAIVAIEDRRFWEHDGIDLRGIGRALVADIRHKKVVEGG